jgi:hypothetical protein
VNDHALCCDCDACLNRGGGASPTAVPAVSRTRPEAPPPWRLRARQPLGALELAKARAHTAATMARRANEEVNRLESAMETHR